MAERHPIVYDLDRWRRFRNLLLFPATICTLVAIFLTVLVPRRSEGASPWLIVAVSLYSLATSFWLRQRYSYLSLDGEILGAHVLGGRTRLPVSGIRRIRVAKLIGQLDRGDRRRFLPRPRRRWEDADALVIQVSEHEDMRPLRRVLGRRCVFDDEIIVPVGAAPRLRDAVTALMHHADPDRAAAPRRARRRRKR